MSLSAPRSGQLVRFEPAETWPSLWRLAHAARENTLQFWTAKTFESPSVRVKGGMVDALFLSDPDGLRHVLTHPNQFRKAPMQQRVLKPALKDGMLTAEGEHWAWQRRALQPAFMAQALATHPPRIAAITQGRLRTWAERGAGARLDIHHEMMELTLDILCGTLFSGLEFDHDILADWITTYFDVYVRPGLLDVLGLPTWVPRPKDWRIRPYLKRVDTLMAELIAARRADPNPPDDLLSRMMAARDDETGRTLNDEDLKANLLTFLGAGHETTAVALTWALYLLYEFPEAAARIRAEADAVLGDAPVTSAMIAKLTYTRQVFEEGMRLYAPVPMFDRVSTGDDEVAGEKVGKGTAVVIAPYVLHRHRLLWEEPDIFNPDNFTLEAVRARHRYAFIPFNGGPRACIGASFAMMEGVLALAMITRAVDLDLIPGSDLTPVALISLRPRGGMPMTVRMRP